MWIFKEEVYAKETYRLTWEWDENKKTDRKKGGSRPKKKKQQAIIGGFKDVIT